MKKKKIKIIFGGICFIFIALCVLCFYVTKKVQTPQVLNEIYSFERSEEIENFEEIENTIEMNEHVSADDLANQALVEESDEVKESDETNESDEAEESNETNESDEAEDAALVFDRWIDFSGMSFSEELGLPYVDDETFEAIKAVYEQIDFFGEFQSGNQEVYDEYKEKYKELLENDGLVFDPEEEVSVPFSQIDIIKYHIENYGLQKFAFYFFDIDGDDLPELSVHYEYGGNICILDYDSKKDVFSVWYPLGSYWYSLIGTKKVQWMGLGKYLVSYFLDESGKEACETFFFHNQYSEDVYLAIVMLPKYAEEEKNTKLTETMKSQGIYTCSGSRWFFRINKEQYDELAEPYWEAYDMAKEKKKEVTYTYEELFGGM